MAGPKLLIEAPERAEREAGIEKVATFRPNDRLGVVETVVFQSDGCTFPQLDEHHCYTGEATPDPKTFDGISIDDAIGGPFPLYAGVQCTLNADEEAEFNERARRALEQGQGRELEAQLAAWADGGTALTTPTGAGLQQAIARVEQALDAGYVGRGVLLMSRFDAIMAGAVNSIEPNEDGILSTKVGTPVIASGRIAPGTVYGIGAVVVEHSETQVYPVLRPEYNQRYALAEAVFVLAVDCEFRVKSATS